MLHAAVNVRIRSRFAGPSEKGPVSGGHSESTAHAHRDQRRGITELNTNLLTVCVSQPAYRTEHKHPPKGAVSVSAAVD